MHRFLSTHARVTTGRGIFSSPDAPAASPDVCEGLAATALLAVRNAIRNRIPLLLSVYEIVAVIIVAVFNHAFE